MHDNSLIERGLRALREYAQRKIYNKLIVAKLKERLQFGLKARTLVALGENIRFKKTQREQFYRKIVFLAEKRMILPFLHWKEHVEYEKMEEKAT